MSREMGIRLGPLSLRDIKLLSQMLEDQGILNFEVVSADPDENFYQNAKPGEIETYQANTNLALVIFTNRIKELNGIIVPMGLSPIPENFESDTDHEYYYEQDFPSRTGLEVKIKDEHKKALQEQSELSTPHHSIYVCPKGDFQSDIPRLCPKHQIPLRTLKEGERPMSPLKKFVFFLLGLLGAAQLASELLKIFSK